LKRVADAYRFETPDELFTPTPALPAAAPNGQQLPTGPAPFQNGAGQLVPQPAMATLAGNAR